MDLDEVFSRNRGFATRKELLAAGATYPMLRRRVASGRWSMPLPGIYGSTTGPLDLDGSQTAALLYTGAEAVLSHTTAARLHGLRVIDKATEVTIPHGRHLGDAGFVRVHQSARPTPADSVRGFPVTTVARTVIDVATTMRWLSDVRALVADSVQRSFTTVEALTIEAEVMPARGSALLRKALEEITAGARSAGEADFYSLVRDAGLPLPEMNALVVTSRGEFRVDALWRRHRVGAEIDGRLWHLGPASWEADLRRQNAIHASGITLLRFPVTRVRDEPGGVLAEVRAAIHHAKSMIVRAG